MVMEKTDTLVIGAGQAGIALSEHLSKLDVPHLVLERQRIAERWRSERWDSLVCNGPAWHDRFPGLDFDDVAADAFAGKERVADYLEAYARKFHAPIRTGVEVLKVVRNDGRPGFTVETSAGVFEANRVVAATGPFQQPLIPQLIPADSPVTQMHSAAYRNPQQLPPVRCWWWVRARPGCRLPTNCSAQAVRCICRSARDRPPRRYRERDFCWWLGVLGEWDAQKVKPGREHVTIAVSGARGGHTVDFRRLAEQGITLLGMTRSCENGVMQFQPDLAENIARGDENYLGCWTLPMPISRKTGWTCRQSRKPGNCRRTRPACGNPSCRWTWLPAVSAP
jgi:putative flavoprotein involved in K+ transport